VSVGNLYTLRRGRGFFKYENAPERYNFRNGKKEIGQLKYVKKFLAHGKK